MLGLSLTSVDANWREPDECGPEIFSMRVATVRYKGEVGDLVKTEWERAANGITFDAASR
jgi:hypothetical protein